MQRFRCLIKNDVRSVFRDLQVLHTLSPLKAISKIRCRKSVQVTVLHRSSHLSTNVLSNLSADVDNISRSSRNQFHSSLPVSCDLTPGKNENLPLRVRDVYHFSPKFWAYLIAGLSLGAASPGPTSARPSAAAPSPRRGSGRSPRACAAQPAGLQICKILANNYL